MSTHGQPDDEFEKRASSRLLDVLIRAGLIGVLAVLCYIVFAPFLTPGNYSIRVELSGFAPVEQRNVLVRLGQRTTLTELTLKPGGITETVQVTATSPVIDVRSTTAGAVLDNEIMKRLPIGRKFTDTLYMVPGVSDSSGVGSANATFTVRMRVSVGRDGSCGLSLRSVTESAISSTVACHERPG